jgi:hypothetical protein
MAAPDRHTQRKSARNGLGTKIASTRVRVSRGTQVAVDVGRWSRPPRGFIMKIMQSKRLFRLIALCAAAATSSLAPASALAQDRVVGREALDPKDQETLPPAIDGRTDSDEDVDPRALEEFREPLAPHGAWIDDPTYGTIWVPDARVVGPDFTPYQTAGHWELTSDGDWLWVSDYAWGDIPFHYGRWVWVSGPGWAWIPGRVWAPAWVVWRTGPYGYVGWGPCPPTWGWYGGSAVWLWWPPPAPYWFVETRYVFGRHVHRHVIREPARVANAARQTTPLRRPASPGRNGLDAHRPARPDFDQMRYEGVRPTARPVERHPEVGLDRSRRGSASGVSARDGRPEVGRARSPGTAGLRRDGGSRDGVARGDGRGITPSTRPDHPPARNDGPRGVKPRGDTDPDRSTPDREARPARGPSDPPTRDPGRGPARDVSPSRDVSPPAPSRDLGPRDSGPRTSGPGPSSPSRPSTSTSTRRPSTSTPSAPASKGRSSGPRRGRR